MDGNRFAAVDTKFLLALHAGDSDCEAVVDWLTGNNIFPLITPCVVQELVDMVDHASPFASQQAREVLSSIAVWGFITPPPQEGLWRDIARTVAQKLIARGVVDTDDLNDCLVVVEAACEKCVLLLTPQKSLLDAGYEHLRLALLESHVPDVMILEVKHIVEFLNAKFDDGEDPASSI